MTPNVYIRIHHGADEPHVLTDDERDGDDGMTVQVEDLAMVELMPPTADELAADGDDRPAPFWEALTIDLHDPDMLVVRIADTHGKMVIFYATHEQDGEIRYGGPEFAAISYIE